MAKKKQPDFEKSLAGLEALVEKLEKGDLPLDKTLKEFEEGIRLARVCQQALADAEQTVEILLSQDDSDEPEAFDSD
ncbi:MAG: exodeoxyribonuclease VII small subunit [Pseudomonadota bacterium]